MKQPGNEPLNGAPGHGAFAWPPLILGLPEEIGVCRLALSGDPAKPGPLRARNPNPALLRSCVAADGLWPADGLALPDFLPDPADAAARALEAWRSMSASAPGTRRGLGRVRLLGGRHVVLSLVALGGDEVAAVCVDCSEAQHGEEFFRTLVEDQTEWIARFGRGGVLEFANTALRQAFGLSPTGPPAPAGGGAGKPTTVLSLLHPDSRNAAVSLLAALTPESPLTKVELRMLPPPGAPAQTQRWAEWTLRSLQTPEGGFQAVGRDLTERLRAEEEVRQIQKLELVGTLAGAISHDFNNVLQVIVSWTEILTRSDLPLHVLEPLASVHGAAKRGTKLARQLLSMSARRAQPSPTIFDLGETLRELEPFLQRMVGDSFDLILKVPPAATWIHADAGQAEQAAMNLVANARDATPSGGAIRVTLSLAEADPIQGPGAPGVARLEVRDTGSGMDADTLSKVFAPFYTTKPEGRGTGLGLFIVSQFVQRVGGRTDIESLPGQGTSVRLLLPLSRPPRPLEQPEARDDSGYPAPLPEGRGQVVLLIEDDPDVRRTLSASLAFFGFGVREATNLDQALEALLVRGAPPHCVVSDVSLPGGLSGGEIVRRLRERRPKLPALFVTGHADLSLVEQAMEETGAQLLQKPVPPVRLARRVRALIDGAR